MRKYLHTLIHVVYNKVFNQRGNCSFNAFIISEVKANYWSFFFLFKKYILFYFMCMGILPVCSMSVQHTHAVTTKTRNG